MEGNHGAHLTSTIIDTWFRTSLEGLAETMSMRIETLNDMVIGLEKKGFILFRGTPGTGKTHLADQLSKLVLVRHYLNVRIKAGLQAAALDNFWHMDAWKNKDNKIWKEVRPTVVFHASYSYSNFVQGFRPDLKGEGKFTCQDGQVLVSSNYLIENASKLVIMLIDELNRANVAEVFGELLPELEKRGSSGGVMLGPDKLLKLPKSLYFIGMMNDADRSVGLLDRALQERFFHFRFPLEQQDEVNYWISNRVLPGEKNAACASVLNASSDVMWDVRSIASGLKRWACELTVNQTRKCDESLNAFKTAQAAKPQAAKGLPCLGCKLVESMVFANFTLANLTDQHVPLVAHGRFMSSDLKTDDEFKTHVRLIWKHMVFPILEDILFHRKKDLSKLRFERLFCFE